VQITHKGWNQNIILFLAGQTISLFGSYLVQYAIMWHITLSTKSGIMMTLAIICGFLPTFFISPFAGVWADRFNRKNLIILADSFIAIATLILAILFLMGYDELWLLFVVMAIRAFGSGVQLPTIGAFLPQMVSGDMLTKVNATMTSIESLVSLVSPMASGALLTMATIETIFFIDVVTAAIAIFILLVFLKVLVHAKALNKQASGYFADMREGAAYINNHKYIKSFFIFCAVFFILAAPASFLTPLQVARSFGDDVWRLTAIEVLFSVGMMLGGITIAVWGGFKNRVHTMTLAFLIFGFCTFALGVIPNFWIYLFFMGITGISIPFFNTPATVLLQEKVEEDFLGRVFGVLGMISSVMMPLGMLVFGPLADIVRIEWLLIGTGVLLFIQGFFLVGNKTLVEAGKPMLNPNDSL
jgi:DHA3 family macrolide efflux protein-like MFS transporter